MCVNLARRLTSNLRSRDSTHAGRSLAIFIRSQGIAHTNYTEARDKIIDPPSRDKDRLIVSTYPFTPAKEMD